MAPDDPFLFDIGVEEKLVLCGSQKHNMLNLAKQAVRDWADNAMRKDLQIETSVSCKNARGAAASIELIFDDKEECDGSITGYHEQDGANHVIALCPSAINFQQLGFESTQEEYLLATLRHEVGHAFGLCDQYNPDLIDTDKSTIGFNPDNCDDKKFRSSKAKRSIMGSDYDGSPDNLTADDVLGIQLGACRDDSSNFKGRRSVSVNRQWIEKNSSELSTLHKNMGFQKELLRLIDKGVPMLSECVATTN